MTDERKTELRAVLQEWRGSSAQLWQYSASLAELHVRLKKSAEAGNVHLVCNGCTRIEASTSWAFSAINFVEEVGQPGTYTLKDAASGFLVRCNLVRVMRDVDPVY